jgi:hypothetical protein
MPGFGFRAGIVLGGLLLTLFAAACTEVVGTMPIDVAADGPGPVCHSTLGAYYLPRALIHFTASKDDASGSPVTGTLGPLPLAMVPDRMQPLCLDYLSLATSQDIVTVQRDPSTGLLTSISSDVVDKTPHIVSSLVATAENLALAARSASLTTTNDSLDVEFDPFSPPEMEVVKGAMRRFGFCLYVEGYSFPAAGLDTQRMTMAAQRWCDTNGLPPYENPAERFSALPVPLETMRAGVLYRPNMTHKIVILYKKDPNGPGPWTLYQTKRLDMPNVSPVLSIGVERATFTERQTTLNFNLGVLTDVAVNKKSELVGFVSIPLTVAQAIVSLPQQLVTLRITDVNNQAALLNAQNSLLQAVALYQSTVAGNPLPAGAPQSARLRGGELIKNCSDGQSLEGLCVTTQPY